MNELFPSKERNWLISVHCVVKLTNHQNLLKIFSISIYLASTWYLTDPHSWNLDINTNSNKTYPYLPTPFSCLLRLTHDYLAPSKHYLYTCLYPRTGRAAPEGGAGADVGLRPGLRLERRSGRQREVLHGHQEHRLHVGAALSRPVSDVKHRSQFWFLYNCITIDIVCVGSMCGTDYFVNGMSWFTAMECCYYNKGYLAEPQNQAEQDKIVQYITAGTVQCSTV